jgi:hypothetical protein
MIGFHAPTVMTQASPGAQAKATIRVLSGAVASQKEWKRTSTGQKRKISVTDETGKRLTLYVIEFE